MIARLLSYLFPFTPPRPYFLARFDTTPTKEWSIDVNKWGKA